jgi:hypothetical protein|tara:strand:- start:15 stop:290 length:276 start_codon:yes stop_codon:yes gene_type:complete
MPKYIVTGGESGTSGINYNGERYEAGAVVEVSKPKGLWLIDEGYLALESEVVKERARNDKGHYIPDDPETPDINEAFVQEEEPPKKIGGKK